MLTPRLLINAALIGITLTASTLHAIAPDSAPEATITQLPAVDPTLVEDYTEMLQTIAAPEMEGRVPGSQGIERAAQYIETHLRDLGLKPAFEAEPGDLIYRQPMQMGVHTAATAVKLAFADTAYTSFDDASPLAFSGSGTVTAPVVFAGYGIVSGPNNYLGFGSEDTVENKIAIILNYEPMNEDGSSQWKAEGWTHNSRLTYKVTALDRRGAAGVIIVSPPNAQDERAGVLETVESTSPPAVRMGQRGGPQYDIPVVHATPSVTQAILTHLGSDANLADLIEQANDSGTVQSIGDKKITLTVELKRTPLITENIGAILPGKGALANEYVVIGAHYDHVGYGKFGTRRASDRGKLHPGADDNASGTAANIITARLLKQRYDLLTQNDSTRSILFLWFTAEESGLNGSRYYVQNPIAPIENHHIMLNLDMMGTLFDGLLEIGGFESGDGLIHLAKPALETSKIPYAEDVSVGRGRSDHASFDSAGIPALFFFTGLHDRYHTPQDTPDLLDMEGGARIASVVSAIAYDAATNPADIIHPSTRATARENTPPKVRIGIIPSNAPDGGMHIERVFENTSASEAGLRPGDRITKWDDNDIDSVESWMPLLTNHKPGDVVTLEVRRADETLEIEMTLRGIE